MASAFDFLKKLFAGAENAQDKNKLADDKLVKFGNVDPMCPHCGFKLPTMPKARRKCPQCKNPILLKTRPADRKKVLIKEEERAFAEEQWRLYYAIEAKKAYPEIINRLQEAESDYNWGLYRNAKFELSQNSHRRGNPQEALELMLEVCYLDLNGPRNLSGNKSMKSFSVHEGFLADGVLDRIIRYGKELSFTLDDIGNCFSMVADKDDVRRIRLPLGPDKAWSKISEEIEPYYGA